MIQAVSAGSVPDGLFSKRFAAAVPQGLFPGHAVGFELGNDVGGDFIVEARPASTCGHARLLEAPGRQCNAFADRIDPDVLAGVHANGESICRVIAGTTSVRRFNMPDKPTIVFAHGLWADGSCYSKVIPLLMADGFQVISTQNHLNTVADDAAAPAERTNGRGACSREIFLI